MESIRNKIKNVTAYRKMNNLWKEYKKASQIKNNPEALQRLKKFLDHAQVVLK